MGAEFVEYTVVDRRGNHIPARGQEIGRFAVRELEPPTMRITQGTPYPFVVDHVSTGIVMADWSDRVRAWQFADELSRFSQIDPVGPLPRHLLHQLGQQLVAWITWMKSNHLPEINFREWLAAQSVTLAYPLQWAPMSWAKFVEEPRS